MKQIQHLIVSLIFVLFISIPAGVALFFPGASVSQEEKRKLAELPELNLSVDSLKAFPASFDTYINDHFGFRSLIVRAHNYILVKVFGVSPSKLVVIGSNDWYFFNGDNAIKDYLGHVSLSKRRLEKISHLLQDRKRWLASIGARYLFLPVPNKEMIYDEYLPSKIRRNRGISIYDQVIAHLLEKRRFEDYIDVKGLLFDNKSDRDLFLRTDSHWNHHGTFLTFDTVMERIAEWLPDIDRLKNPGNIDMIRDFSGDLAILMNLRGLVTEDAPDVLIKDACKPRDYERMSELLEIPQYRNLGTHRLPVISGCSDQKYKAVVFHDSFGRFLRPYLSQQFDTVIFINHLNFEDAKSIIEQERPDIVIDQRVARNLLKALRPDHDLEQTVLSSKFETITQMSHSRGGPALHNTIDLRGNGLISRDTNGVGFELETEKSSLSIVVESSSEPGPEIVRLDLSSDKQATIRLCYEADASSAEPMIPECVKRTLAVGQNSLYLRILEPLGEGRIILTPLQPGGYHLASLTIKKDAL